jgi:two-component system sensor histidine kinase PilS (NtrC family)
VAPAADLTLDAAAKAISQHGRWMGLQTLIWARLLVAALALPIGVVLGREANLVSWQMLGISVLVVGAASAVLWLGTLLRRGLEVQLYAHLGLDIALVTGLAALSGGRSSPFALFYVLVAISGGLHARLLGGLVASTLACLGFLLLPWLSRRMLPAPVLGATLPSPGMLVALLLIVGVLAGVLGRRAQQDREHLDRASRELSRVRFDHDAILRHLTSGVITLDAAGTVAYLNPTAAEVLGVRLREVQGRWVQDALPSRLQPLRDALLAVLEHRTPLSRGELLVKTAAGRPLPVGLSTNVLTHEGAVTGVVAVFQDLSEVREMEQRARRNQTLAEVGALAAGIAHELRNGLNPISGSVECLQRELKLDGENAQLMDLISNECTRLNRFVTDLLTYSRERPLAREMFDLNENLDDLCEGLARDPRRVPGVSVVLERGPEAADIAADREQLRQVWLNLASNALEAMGEQGTLVVRWREGDAGQVVVEFVDSGPGIAAEDLPRVGQPFFTTKEGGTGLGLAIAQRIVERHGGTLAFESAPSHGTVARVTLPCAPPVAARAA